MQPHSTYPTSVTVPEVDLSALVRDLETLVMLESPTSDPTAVSHVQDVVETWARELGAACHALPGGTRQFCFGDAGGRPLLVLAHADTVWPVGTLSQMPFKVEGNKLHGPGTYDMKGGIVGLIHALRAMDGTYPAGGIEVLLSPDEETGSHRSRDVIEKAAQRARAVLVVEPPVAGSHALKTGRKGVGQFSFTFTGVASHAGNKPEEGASAISEAARQVAAVEALARPDLGTTLSVGRIEGGGAVNVIAAQASFEVDVRVSSLAEGERVAQAVNNLTLDNPRVSVQVAGGLNRPPFERGPQTLELYRQAAALAQHLGFDLSEAVVGGGSDGNFTATLCPTLDGLGAPGDGAHAQHEHIRLDRWPAHVRLLGALLRSL